MFPRLPAVSKRVLHDDSHDEGIVDFHLFLEDSLHERAGQRRPPQLVHAVPHSWRVARRRRRTRLVVVLAYDAQTVRGVRRGRAATTRAHFRPWS